jgi:hypothetical protein
VQRVSPDGDFLLNHGAEIVGSEVTQVENLHEKESSTADEPSGLV